MRFYSPTHFFKFAREHRITIRPESRWKGIFLNLFAWALIAVATAVFDIQPKALPSYVNFTVQFSIGALVLFLASIIYGFFSGNGLRGYRLLMITAKNEVTGESHLSRFQRTTLIYARGLIATGGYVIYELAKVEIGSIDNSIVHGADALMYALLSWGLLRQHFSFREWLGILVAFAGIALVFVFDTLSDHQTRAFIGYVFGVGSSVALAVIIILTSVIVQHDHPMRVAFHQCAAGLIILIPLAVYVLAKYHNFYTIFDQPAGFYRAAIIGGICYAVALTCFFQSFFYVEPIVIALASYSLPFYLSALHFATQREWPSIQNIACVLLIATGTAILIHAEYQKDPKHGRTRKS